MILEARDDLLAVTDVADMLRQYSEGRRDLYGANLYRANLYRANLYGANLGGANLYRADLYGANLYGANLYRASLIGANLPAANLYGANLSGANLSGANLSGAQGIVSAGPVGDGGRILYAVDYGDKIMVQAGCRWDTAEAVTAAIDESYADQPKLRRPYVLGVEWMVAQIEANRQSAKSEVTQ